MRRAKRDFEGQRRETRSSKGRRQGDGGEVCDGGEAHDGGKGVGIVEWWCPSGQHIC